MGKGDCMMRGTPGGKQNAVGLSFASCFLNAASPSGVYGTSSSLPMDMSITDGISQKPDRSGLPSAARGIAAAFAGADWAAAGASAHTKVAKTTTTPIGDPMKRFLIRAPLTNTGENQTGAAEGD